MNLYKVSLPDSVQNELAQCYESLFKVLISRVTFWGVNDSHSWLSGQPIRNRTNYPLLFDRGFEPKKPYQAIINLKHKKH